MTNISTEQDDQRINYLIVINAVKLVTMFKLFIIYHVTITIAMLFNQSMILVVLINSAVTAIFITISFLEISSLKAKHTHEIDNKETEIDDFDPR